jgi:hypothetical protein
VYAPDADKHGNECLYLIKRETANLMNPCGKRKSVSLSYYFYLLKELPETPDIIILLLATRKQEENPIAILNPSYSILNYKIQVR